MEKEKRIVTFKPSAEKNIFQIYTYIVSQEYPETAEKFADQLYDFGYKLNRFPFGYPVCRHEKFRKRNLHCAVFHKNYIFVYKVTKNKVIIYNVIHGKTLK